MTERRKSGAGMLSQKAGHGWVRAFAELPTLRREMLVDEFPVTS